MEEEMKYSECKPCKYFKPKPREKKRTTCYFCDEENEEQIPIKDIIWCQEFEKRISSVIDKRLDKIINDK